MDANFNKHIIITPKQQSIINTTAQAWNQQIINQTMDQGINLTARRNQVPINQAMNLSAHRGSNHEKGRYNNNALQISNDIIIQNMGMQNQSVLTPNKTAESAKQSQQNQQFPVPRHAEMLQSSR